MLSTTFATRTVDFSSEPKSWHDWEERGKNPAVAMVHRERLCRIRWLRWRGRRNATRPTPSCRFRRRTSGRRRVPVRVGGIDQDWCEALHPAVQGDVINGDAAFGEEFFEITVGETETRCQRTANIITSGGTGSLRTPTTPPGARGDLMRRCLLIPTASPTNRHARCNSAHRSIRTRP